MPPPNRRRRDHLAAAAITVLAGQGCRGLTHRAVDTAAGVPAGTTSRYFRTRDALIDGVVDLLTRRLRERVDDYTVREVDRADLADALAAVMGRLAADDPHEPLALFELHLESNRNPRLRGLLTDAIHARRDLIGRQSRAAGVDITDEDALLLEMSVLGVLFTTLTSDAARDPGAAIRSAVQAVLSGYL